MDPNYEKMAKQCGEALTDMMLSKGEPINEIMDTDGSVAIACAIKIKASDFPASADVKITFRSVDGDQRHLEFDDPKQQTFDTVLTIEGQEGEHQENTGDPAVASEGEQPNDAGAEEPAAQPDVGEPEPFEIGADASAEAAPPTEHPGEAEAPKENQPEVTADLAYTNQDAGIEPKKRGRKSKKA